MTDGIVIKPGVLTDHGWSFTATVRDQLHAVHITQQYWLKITHGDIPPMDVVRLALDIVVEQGRTSSLPADFGVDDLIDRIPNFEKRLRVLAQTEAAANPK